MLTIPVILASSERSFSKFKLLKSINMGPVEILKFLKRYDCFPNATIAYRGMLTIYSCDSCIIGMKLFKTQSIKVLLTFYNNNLAMIARESDMLEKIDYVRTIKA